MKSEAVFKKAFNNFLDYIGNSPSQASLESESHLADFFKISRTTVRKVLNELDSRQLISRNQSSLIIVRRPGGDDYFPLADTVATADRVEKQFMEWMLRSDRKPNQHINELELARQFGVSTGAIREYLNRFIR